MSGAIRQHPHVDRKLLAALRRTWPQQIATDMPWDAALVSAQQRLETEKARIRAQIFTKWKRRILQNDKFVLHWLKQTVLSSLLPLA